MLCCHGRSKELALLNSLSILSTPLLLLYILYRALKAERAIRQAQVQNKRAGR